MPALATELSFSKCFYIHGAVKKALEKLLYTSQITSSTGQWSEP